MKNGPACEETVDDESSLWKDEENLESISLPRDLSRFRVAATKMLTDRFTTPRQSVFSLLL